MNAIELNRISKSFKGHAAVKELSLQVPTGSVYGFIGPNGSGKTTTLRMILRVYYPDAGSGTIRVLGEDNHQAANDRIGYLPEERGLYRKMRVRDLLKFFLELKGRTAVGRTAVGAGDLNNPIETWLDRLGMADWANKKIETLSKGMSQKIQFILAVIHSPDLLILDEPFAGLDPVNVEVIREAVLSLRDQGTTIIFSTHDMSVAEQMCDYIFMIYQGEKVLDGTLASIQDTYGTDTLRVGIQGGKIISMSDLEGVEKVTDFGHLQELRMANGADTQRVLEALMRRGRVTHFEVTQPSLNDIFIRIAKPNFHPSNDKEGKMGVSLEATEGQHA